MNEVRYLFTHSVVILTLVSCASGPPSYVQNIQSAISGSGNVFVRHVDEGIVILTGWVDNAYSRTAVQKAALKSDQVTRVINRISVE